VELVSGQASSERTVSRKINFLREPRQNCPEKWPLPGRWRNQTRWPKMRAHELREVGTRARKKKCKSTHSQPVAAGNHVDPYT
jgi:hypothetical protein